ncbi:MAG: MFS transporter [Fluviicola sp.]|nr:MFS transporter [Fluviicola sp.]MBP6272547.1 MFS transporter [Fluviicola sp.]
MSKQTATTNYGALSTLTTVFFFWGFIAAGNSVFIPFCKHYFKLDQFQSQLIDFAFYGAYYLGALGLFVFSYAKRKDLVGSWGYKKSIIIGLLVSALGAVAMIVSVFANQFAGMLFGLFIVALGFSLQQTSANPFMIALGDEKTGSNRINLGGGINSLGTTIGPVLVSLALFGTAAAISDDMIAQLSLNTVVFLYAGVGALFVGIALLLTFSKKVPAGKIESDSSSDNETDQGKKAVVTLLVITGILVACFSPVFSSYRSDEAKQLVEIEGAQKELTTTGDNKTIEISQLTPAEKETYTTLEKEHHKIQQGLDKNRIIWLSLGIVAVVGGLLFANTQAKKSESGWGAMKYPQLTLGMLAIFSYVGVEVAVGSNLGELLKQPSFGGLSSSEITPYVSMYWGSLMIGRWTGAVNAFNLSQQMKTLLKFIVPLIAFAIILIISKLSGYEVDNLYWYIGCVVVQILAMYIANDKPALSLTIFGALGVLSLLVGLTATGDVAIYGLLSAGLFCSIMWPCIFSLSLAGLGKYQGQGSSLLVMMILGGALIPPLQGKLSDLIGIQESFVIGAFCFAYILFFAIYVNQLLKKRGVSLDETPVSH